MPTAKPPYAGDGGGENIPDFSDALRAKLRDFYPGSEAKDDPVWGHPADTFVERLFSEADWARSELHWQRSEATKQEIRAERSDLLKCLQKCEDRLRSLSPDFDRLLGVDADPLECADRLASMIKHVRETERSIDELPKALKHAEKRLEVATELAVCVLRVLKDFGIPVSATADTDFGYSSDAVKVLKLIGDDMGLVRSELTWRDTVLAAKKKAPDL